jgi:hypothetical protein
MRPTAIKSIILTLIFSVIYSLTALSQDVHFPSAEEKNQHKPQLFDKDQERTVALSEFFETVSLLQLNQEVTLQVTPKTKFIGRVTSITVNNTIRMVAMRSTEIPCLVLMVSQIDLNTKRPSYRGIMFSNNHKDLLMLEIDATSGKHIWHKKELSDILPD